MTEPRDIRYLPEPVRLHRYDEFLGTTVTVDVFPGWVDVGCYPDLLPYVASLPTPPEPQ